MAQPHFIVISYPAQGHINPSLQLSKRLIRAGADVTFVTSTYASERMSKFPTMDGLNFVTFPDGSDSGFRPTDALEGFMSEFERLGSQALTDLVIASANEGRPVTCIIYGILIPWIAEAARGLHIPSALFWSQPISVFNIYYYYFHGYGEHIRRKVNDFSASSPSIELPGLPLLDSRDIPSFLLPANTNSYRYILSAFEKHLQVLLNDSNPTVVVNTFDALEPEALKAVGKFKSIGVGPLFPTAFLGGKDPSDTTFGGDLFRRSKDYIQWLNSKPKSSVIYVSFGSLAVLSKQQSEELARGLLDSGRPFLWVMREKGEERGEDELSCYGELEEQGLIVPWCSQVEVLSNPSLGCFVTHCGWNSTLESLASGVPVVAFPQWTDQSTNAKLAQDVWRMGVRVTVNQEGIVEGDEIKRCIELVMGDGEEAKEMRRNAKKWKGLAREAVMEGGSSDANLKNFMDELINIKNHD